MRCVLLFSSKVVITATKDVSLLCAIKILHYTVFVSMNTLLSHGFSLFSLHLNVPLVMYLRSIWVETFLCSILSILRIRFVCLFVRPRLSNAKYTVPQTIGLFLRTHVYEFVYVCEFVWFFSQWFRFILLLSHPYSAQCVIIMSQFHCTVSSVTCFDWGSVYVNIHFISFYFSFFFTHTHMLTNFPPFHLYAIISLNSYFSRIC